MLASAPGDTLLTVGGQASRSVAQWVLLCALVVGVLGMHHLAGDGLGQAHGPGEHGGAHSTVLAATEVGTAERAAAPPLAPPSESGHGGGVSHDLLHMCMAVLSLAAALALLLRLAPLARRPKVPRRDSGPSPNRATGPPAVYAGRSVLHSVCVLRL